MAAAKGEGRHSAAFWTRVAVAGTFLLLNASYAQTVSQCQWEDHPGKYGGSQNLLSDQAEDLDACKALCQARSDCVAVDFVDHTLYGYCLWHKDPVPVSLLESEDHIDFSSCPRETAADDQEPSDAPQGETEVQQETNDDEQSDISDVNPQPGSVSGATSTQQDYMGCYRDSRAHRILDRLVFADTQMTPPNCFNFCRHSNYYGVSYGKECWCGDTAPGAHLQRPESECNIDCGGVPGYKCGGTWRVNLYRTPQNEGESPQDW